MLRAVAQGLEPRSHTDFSALGATALLVWPKEVRRRGLATVSLSPAVPAARVSKRRRLERETCPLGTCLSLARDHRGTTGMHRHRHTYDSSRYAMKQMRYIMRRKDRYRYLVDAARYPEALRHRRTPPQHQTGSVCDPTRPALPCATHPPTTHNAYFPWLLGAAGWSRGSGRDHTRSGAAGAGGGGGPCAHRPRHDATSHVGEVREWPSHASSICSFNLCLSAGDSL